MDRKQFTAALDRGVEMYELIEIGNDGATNHYKGRREDIDRFLAGADNKHHEHKVYRDGKLVYHRDRDGRVLVGSDWQKRKNNQKRTVGAGALAGAGLRKSWDRMLRWNGYR